MKKLTRLAELEIHAEAAGLIVRTWSPGDGVTRYRFFEDRPGRERQDYFGPENGIYTALGLAEAWTFVRGAKVNA